MDPGDTSYNIPSAYELTGQLNIEALRRAFNEIVRRHEVFRTTFLTKNGQPFQVVAAPQVFDLPLIDLGGMRAQDKTAEVCRRYIESAEQRFDLSRGPLFSASLLCLGEKQHVLLFCMHHIVSDGWSMGIFFKELAALFESFSRGESSPLPDLPIQYADFALWQREWLQGPVLEKQLGYWKRQLADLVHTPILLSDRPRPPIQTHRGTQHSHNLDPVLTQRLRALARAERVTLFMVLLAAFKVLLYRHSSETHVAVGSPVANRNWTETEDLIGFFVNTLVLSTDLSGNPPFKELLARVRATAVGAYGHQDLPFEMLVDELRPVRNLGRSPLFQIMFTVQNMSTDFSLGGLSATPLRLGDSHPAKFDITWLIIEKEADLRLSLTYNTDLFDAVTIARLGRHFESLLESIVSNPNQRIDALAVMSDEEKRQILVEWNATQADYPSQPGLHELFETQVERAPEALAIVFGPRRWTYVELNQRANRLAHHLRKAGVGAEDLVGICLDRSAELIVSLLAILKAGGAYVPLDPTYPAASLSFMVGDSGIRRLVTEERMLDRLPRDFSGTVCLDRDAESIAAESQENIEAVSAGGNAAYVIYTSGSTGRPKGVVVTHRSVTRLVVCTDYVQLKATDVVAQVSNASFDAMTFEVWGALLNGACLAGISTDVLLSPKVFIEEIRKQRISAMFLTTSLFEQVAREDPTAFRTIDHLLYGGEAADPASARAVLIHGAPRRLLNMYGPTETTTFASYHVVEHVPENALNVPIGRPIKNCQLHLLDSHLRPVPTGAPGELYIGGDGLARGYLNRPELTAERFIANPFSSDPAARLYKTGDLARYRSDGTIEWLARLDQQIKLRGFRIEPGEIEEALKLHPGVQQATVLARERGAGDKRLSAFVVARDQSGPTAAELRRWVQSKLPPYMTPSEFVFLTEFPLTPNGKVDRVALLNLRAHDRASELALEDPDAGPRDALETQLVKIWTRVLNRPAVGIRDNFFDLGGHSLLAVRLLSQIEQTTGKRLSLAAVFQTPTIEEMATLLRTDSRQFQRTRPAVQSSSAGKKSDVGWSPLVVLQPNGSRLPFFWIHGEASNAVLAQYLGPDQPVYGLDHQSEDGTAARFKTVEEIADLYLREIRSMQPKGPYFIGGYCFGGLVTWQIAQELKRDPDGVAMLALLDPTTPAGSKEDRAALREAVAATSRSRISFREISSHLRNVWHLRPSHRWGYLWPRVQGTVSALIPEAVQDWTRAAVCACFIGLGFRIPYILRSFYILRLYMRARDRYRARSYSGPVSMFVCAGTEVVSRWHKLATGGLRVVEIPGDHIQILQEPYVKAWAEELSNSLKAAQQRARM